MNCVYSVRFLGAQWEGFSPYLLYNFCRPGEDNSVFRLSWGSLSISEDVEKLSQLVNSGLAGVDARPLSPGNYISQAPCRWGLFGACVGFTAGYRGTTTPTAVLPLALPVQPFLFSIHVLSIQVSYWSVGLPGRPLF